MTATATAPALRLHRLSLVHDSGLWGEGSEPVVTGVLTVTGPHAEYVALVPDTVTLLTSLWSRRPYGATRALLRPGQGPDGTVTLSAVWAGGTLTLIQTPEHLWKANLRALAGKVITFLRDQPGAPAALVSVLAPIATHSPALAGPDSGATRDRRP